MTKELIYSVVVKSFLVIQGLGFESYAFIMAMNTLNTVTKKEDHNRKSERDTHL